MDSKVVVTHNMQRISALLRGLGDKKSIQKAVSRSIKRTLTTVRKAAVQELRAKKLIKLSAAEAKQKIHLFNEAKAGKPVQNQYGKIWFGSKPESLGKFYAQRISAGRSHVIQRRNNRGGWEGVRLYKVKLNPWGQPYLKDPKRSFLVKRGKGSVVFQRLGHTRTPIDKLKGPSMAELVGQSGMIPNLAGIASRRYSEEFDRNVEFYAKKALERAKAFK